MGTGNISEKSYDTGKFANRDEDIIIFSDLDEIPKPDKVKEVISLFDDNVIYHFAQRMFYFYVNYEDISHQLLASCGEF